MGFFNCQKNSPVESTDLKTKTIKIDCKGTNYIPLQQLQYFQGNLKELSETNYKKLRSSIEKYGFKFPVFVWKDNLIDGHQRVFTLKKMVEEGWTVDKIPVVEIQAETEEEAKKLLLLINSRYGQMTTDGLYEYLETNKIDLDFLKTELDLSGKGIDLERFENEFYIESEPEDDEVPEIQKTDIKLGDLFQLGEHKLLCGDSTKVEDVKKLMRDEKADMMFTDPPYGVDYSSKNEFLNNYDKGNLNQKPIENDIQLINIEKAFINMKYYLNDNASYYIFSAAGGELMMMMMMMAKAELPHRHMIIWVKNNHVLGRTDYNYKHEPIHYGWIKKHKFYGKGEQVFSVWNYDKPVCNDLHPTMKPIALIINALQNSSQENDICIDFFGGSGSTLIACEKTKRKCRMIEIDPLYCQVIIDRWEKLFNKKAEKI